MKDNQVLQTIRARYSCRNFGEKQVSDDDLRLIAEASLAAPSGRNRQPYRVIVIKDRALIQEMDDAGMEVLAGFPDKSFYERIKSLGGIFYRAPALLVVAVTKVEPAGAEIFDCAILAQTAALAATSIGVDNLICGLAALPFAGAKGVEFKRRLGFPEGYEIGIGVLLGHANEAGAPHEPDLSKISFIG
jgi:nitroreductase